MDVFRQRRDYANRNAGDLSIQLSTAQENNATNQTNMRNLFAMANGQYKIYLRRIKLVAR